MAGEKQWTNEEWDAWWAQWEEWEHYQQVAKQEPVDDAGDEAVAGVAEPPKKKAKLPQGPLAKSSAGAPPAPIAGSAASNPGGPASSSTGLAGTPVPW